MSDQINEKLSAFLDDELDSHDVELMSKQLGRGTQSSAKLNRYALISETIKGKSNVFNAESVANQVSQQLQSEPTILAPPRRKSGKLTDSWKTYLAGAAVAATVASVAVFNFNALTQPGSSPEAFPVTVEVQPNNRPFIAENLSMPAATKWSTDTKQSEEIERELNQFLMEHSEFTTQAGIPGMLPYTTIVVYDKQK